MRGFAKRIFLVLFAVLPVPPLSAGEQSIRHIAEVIVQAVGEVSGGAAVATPVVSGEPAKIVRRGLDDSGTATLELAPGRWEIAIEAPGWWSERRSVQVGEERDRIEVRVLPGAKVEGRLALARGDIAPEKLRAEFRFSAPKPAQVEIEKGSSDCTIGDELEFHCVLPAGMVDIGLRARSFVTAWVWDRMLGRGSTADLGTVELHRGSSVVGWIEVAEGPGDPRDALLHLEPAALPGADNPTGERDRLLQRFDARANRRGYFTFEALPPGSYALSVELAGYAPVRRVGIPVVADSESVIREPLELFRSLKLEVNIEPPVDPAGRDWTVELRGFDDAEAEPLRTVAHAGAAELASVVPGLYSVLLTDGDGVRRWWRELEIEPGESELAIFVESFPVRGRVLFGDEGIPADLVFGGSAGVIRVPVRADADGEFDVDLPRGGTWRVDVESAVFQGRKWARLPREKPRSGPARLEIVFPDNELAGRVVDTEGLPVEGAEVILFAAGDLRVDRSAADGGFAFRGVDEGDAILAARLDARGSEERRVQVHATGTLDGIELILVDRVRLSGVVESTAGGVPGALVLALPEGGNGVGVVPEQAFSGRDGYFELSAPSSATELRVAILAPGFPLQVQEVPIDPAIPSILSMGGEGGELVLRPGLDESSMAPGSVLVFHEGFPLDVGTLGMWARRNGANPSEREMRVPRLSAGLYTICTDIEPRRFISLLASGNPGAESCRRVKVYEGDTVEVDLRDDAE